MQLRTVAIQRLHNQRITHPALRRSDQVVAWLGAVQSQEYEAAKWALGLRMPEATRSTHIESAFNEGTILRTHVLRPTWHFVAAPDLRWMLELTAPRVHQALKYANKFYELTGSVSARATALIERALGNGEHLTRTELGAALARGGIALKGVRLALVTIYAELEGVICSGHRRGTQQTYALLADRVRKPKRLERDEALTELTRRYFRSHGPATLRDFVWWSGLTAADARRGLEASGARSESIDGHTYWRYEDRRTSASRALGVQLLPIYDEYFVAYRDHHAVPRGASVRGMLPQAVVSGGHVAGTWKVVRGRDGLVLDVKTQRELTVRERQMLTKTAKRLGRFQEKPISVRTV